MNEDDVKVVVIPCKVRAQDFELRLPMDYYETMVAIAEENGETM